MPFLEGYVPVNIDEKAGRVQPEGDIAFSKTTDSTETSSMKRVVSLP